MRANSPCLWGRFWNPSLLCGIFKISLHKYFMHEKYDTRLCQSKVLTILVIMVSMVRDHIPLKIECTFDRLPPVSVLPLNKVLNSKSRDSMTGTIKNFPPITCKCNTDTTLIEHSILGIKCRDIPRESPTYLFPMLIPQGSAP